MGDSALIDHSPLSSLLVVRWLSRWCQSFAQCLGVVNVCQRHACGDLGRWTRQCRISEVSVALWMDPWQGMIVHTFFGWMDVWWKVITCLIIFCRKTWEEVNRIWANIKKRWYIQYIHITMKHYVTVLSPDIRLLYIKHTHTHKHMLRLFFWAQHRNEGPKVSPSPSFF